MFFVCHRNIRRNHKESKMSVMPVLITLCIGFGSCLKYQCVNQGCSEPITEAQALYTRPQNNYSDLPIKKGDTVYIYGISEDVYLVKHDGSDLYYTLPIKALKVGKIKYEVLQEVDMNRDTCSVPSVLELFNITKSYQSLLYRNNMSTTASNSSYEIKVFNFDKQEFKNVNIPGTIKEEDATVTTYENVITASNNAEVKTDVKNNNHVLNESEADSSTLLRKSPDLVLSDMNVTEDEKQEVDKVLNVDIQKTNAVKHNNKEQKDNLMNSSTDNEIEVLASSEKLNFAHIEEEGKDNSNVTLLIGPSESTLISSGTDNILVSQDPISEDFQDKEKDSSNQIESKKVINSSSRVNISNESTVTFTTQYSNIAQAAVFDKNSNEAKVVLGTEVVNARLNQESKDFESIKSINKLDARASRPQHHRPPLDLIADSEVPDNVSNENSCIEKRVLAKSSDAAATIFEETVNRNENLNEKVPVLNEKSVNPKIFPPFVDKVNIIPLKQKEKIKVSPSVVDQRTNVAQSKQEEELNASPFIQTSTIVNKQDKISPELVHSPKINTNLKEKESNNFYDIIRKQKLDISSLNENVEIVEPVRYLDTFLHYVSNLSTILQTFIPDSLNFYRWFPGKNYVAQNEYCVLGSNCELSENDVTLTFDALKVTSHSFWELWSKSFGMMVIGISLYCILSLIILISLHLNFKTKRKLRSFVAAINHLEKRLLVAKKELSLFEEAGSRPDLQVRMNTKPAEKYDEEVTALEQQLMQFQHRNTELEDKVLYLERELENVSVSALEIHKLLENSLITQSSSKTAEDELETLRTLTEKQELQIEDLIKEMDGIVKENKCLKNDLKKNEKECSAQTKKNLELAEKNRDLTVRLERQIENNTSMKNNYKSEIYQLQSKFEDTLMNLRRYEFEIQEMNRAFLDKNERKAGNELMSFDEEAQLKLQISTLTAINNELTVELKEQKNARRILDEHVGDVIKELKDLKKSYESIEKERNEAVTKLHVLTNYFNDKEAQLHKEIEEKEKLFVENENKDQLLSQKLAFLYEEIQNYKIRNEELKKEIQDQEGSYKIQLAAAEQKARDLWFALRQAERKYQENEKEAATLRNKLLLVETNLSSVNQKLNEKANNINGDASPVPIIYRPAMSPDLLPYGTPTEIIPPPPSPIASHSPEFFPPEPSYSPDERLPPLGGRRVPSPPYLAADEEDFRPPPPHTQYVPSINRNELPVPVSTAFLRTPLHPANRHRTSYIMRRHRSSADSPSSGVSVESLDKSGR